MNDYDRIKKLKKEQNLRYRDLADFLYYEKEETFYKAFKDQRLHKVFIEKLFQKLDPPKHVFLEQRIEKLEKRIEEQEQKFTNYKLEQLEKQLTEEKQEKKNGSASA